MLLAFDFDGALAESDPYVRLAEQQGESEDVAALLDRLSNDDIAFEEGLRSVADRLEGLPVSEAEAAYDHIQIRPGAADLLAALHGADHHVAIVSDAPERAIRSCLDPRDFDVDTVVANRLPTANDAFTGEIAGPLVGRRKDDALEELAAEEGFELGETIAIGDDLRDLPLLQAAGEGIAVDPIPVVEDQCDLTVPSMERLQLRFEERNLV